MSSSSPLNLFLKFIFSLFGNFYAGFLIIFSETPYILYVFTALVIFVWVSGTVIDEKFKKDFWWTRFFIVYLGITLYHFQYSANPFVAFEAFEQIVKKYIII